MLAQDYPSRKSLPVPKGTNAHENFYEGRDPAKQGLPSTYTKKTWAAGVDPVPPLPPYKPDVR